MSVPAAKPQCNQSASVTQPGSSSAADPTTAQSTAIKKQEDAYKLMLCGLHIILGGSLLAIIEVLVVKGPNDLKAYCDIPTTIILGFDLLILITGLTVLFVGKCQFEPIPLEFTVNDYTVKSYKISEMQATVNLDISIVNYNVISATTNPFIVHTFYEPSSSKSFNFANLSVPSLSVQKLSTVNNVFIDVHVDLTMQMLPYFLLDFLLD
eukprot:TRINITY_DN4522_c1_g3_i10.p1 TRINITY_DN4522_c1_g3~~TRINITY_DN4522_c1_g3_i10.p1  ORF type:complete len:209 (+),score=41.63 TRINITY_DN4522_c1_g3_i10:220-846(+)